MSLRDALSFEKFQLKDVWDQIREDPWRIFLGSGTPLSTGMWNGLLGRDDEPIMNQWGGPTEERFARAQEDGIDTESAEGAHAVAQGISQMYAGNYLTGGGGVGVEDWAGLGSGLLGAPPTQTDNSAHDMAVEAEKRKRMQSNRKPLGS